MRINSHVRIDSSCAALTGLAPQRGRAEIRTGAIYSHVKPRIGEVVGGEGVFLLMNITACVRLGIRTHASIAKFLPTLTEWSTAAFGNGTQHESWSLQTLAVDPEYQGRGIGRALVDVVAEQVTRTRAGMCVETTEERNVSVRPIQALVSLI